MMCILCNMMVEATDIRLNTSKFKSKGPYTGHFLFSSIFKKKKLCSVANIVVSMVDGGPFCLHIGGPPFAQTFNAFKIAVATAC